MTSATKVIYPYNDNGTWVFDDLQRNLLVREPFVAGTDKMIDRVVADIPDAATVSGSPSLRRPSLVTGTGWAGYQTGAQAAIIIPATPARARYPR
jgi:hypothetical protein